MIIEVIRNQYTKKSTIGDLFIENIFECHTLEDTVRMFKIPGKTAIPAGKYGVKLTYSPKFKEIVPEVFNVPGFTGIRLHWGNYPEDTAGCPLVGMTKGEDVIYNSKIAYNNLKEKIFNAEKNEEEVWIDIKDTLGPYRFV